MKNMKIAIAALSVGAVAMLAVTTACAKGESKGDSSTKTSESSVVTNENGSVSRTFTECNVTTNGSMVTERRRETRTTTDTEGNVLETSTSEYAQSWTVGDFTPSACRPSIRGEKKQCASEPGDAPAAQADSFLGLKFGEEFKSDAFESDSDEPTMLRTKFTPKKALAGFDDYYVYVTPKTHKVAKVFACAKDAVEPGARWRRHYLIEALEKRYQTWARLCSFSRPCYAFDIGGGRFVTACLAGASRDYETVLVGWDDAMLTEAANETEELREEARKSAREKRKARVSDAAEAF
jgi:hypothetical protein